MVDYKITKNKKQQGLPPIFFEKRGKFLKFLDFNDGEILERIKNGLII